MDPLDLVAPGDGDGDVDADRFVADPLSLITKITNKSRPSELALRAKSAKLNSKARPCGPRSKFANVHSKSKQGLRKLRKPVPQETKPFLRPAAAKVVPDFGAFSHLDIDKPVADVADSLRASFHRQLHALDYDSAACHNLSRKAVDAEQKIAVALMPGRIAASHTAAVCNHLAKHLKRMSMDPESSNLAGTIGRKFIASSKLEAATLLVDGQKSTFGKLQSLDFPVADVGCNLILEFSWDETTNVCGVSKSTGAFRDLPFTKEFLKMHRAVDNIDQAVAMSCMVAKRFTV